jgi:hypothetical protein
METMKTIGEGHFTTNDASFRAIPVIRDRLEDQIDPDQLCID